MGTEYIKYKNFKPTDGLISITQSMYDKIFTKSPRSSDVKFYIEKNGDIYSAYGTVDTSQGVFVGCSARDNPKVSIQEMGNRLASRLPLVRNRGGDDYF